MDIVTAWEYWDERPADPKSVNDKERALAHYAERWGIPSHRLHDEITALRAQGLSVRQAWQQIADDYEQRGANSNA